MPINYFNEDPASGPDINEVLEEVEINSLVTKYPSSQTSQVVKSWFPPLVVTCRSPK